MAKIQQESAVTARRGVLETGRLVVRNLKWIFREQTQEDYGIDAHLEVVEDRNVTGKLLAAQIKSGGSYFTEAGDGSWWFSVKKDDLDYWRDHSLPVIVVLFDPRNETAYWERVDEETVEITDRGGHRIRISPHRRLDEDSRAELAALAAGKPYELRIQRLRLDQPLMRILESGERRLIVNVEELVNDSGGRGDVTVVSVDEGGEDPMEIDSRFLIGDVRPYSEILPELFPWATLDLEPNAYEEADEARWREECVHDWEGEEMESESFSDWRARQQHGTLKPFASSDGEMDHAWAGQAYGNLRPFSSGDGEVAHWRLELFLNDLGSSFLAVDRFASRDSRGS